MTIVLPLFLLISQEKEALLPYLGECPSVIYVLSYRLHHVANFLTVQTT